MSVVLDYETQPDSAANMMSHGVDGGEAYIYPASANWPKAIKKSQLDVNLSVPGWKQGFNFEENVADYLGGSAKGMDHGRKIQQAMADLGMPTTQPVCLSIDTNVMPAQFPIAADYWRGALSACPNPIEVVYGTTALAEYFARLGLIRWHWQSESRGFFGNLLSGPHTVLIQNFGQSVAGVPGSYDVNNVVAADWGQYPRPSGTVTPAPTAPKGDAMFFADKVDEAPNQARTVIFVDPHTGDMVLVGDPRGLLVAGTTNIVNPVQTGFGWVIPSNYPAGEEFLGASELEPNGFTLISRQPSWKLAKRQYQFSGKA